MSKAVCFMTKNFGKYDVKSIGSYMAIGGFDALKKAVNMTGEEIAATLATAQIKGRGGAGYDMGKKWSQAKAVIADSKVVVCNADEGEPCTFKDRTLIENDPFNLIEGMIIAGYTVDAQNGYIYLREEYSHLRPLLLDAIKQAKTYGFLGENILGKGFNYNIHLYSGAGAYVCGEGTALVESIEGKSGRPRMKPPFIKQCGLYNLPTCVNNVESLSLVSSILLDDEKKYLTYGTEGSVGTKLVSVAGNVKNPGVFEIPFGVTVRDIVYGLAGGIVDDHEIKLIQFGGASGKFAPKSILDTPYTYEDLRKAGVGVGSGAILVVDERTSVIDFLKTTQEFFSHESCGQCTPCREGNRHIKLLLKKVAEGTHTALDLASMRKIAKIMAMSSLCGLGETAQSALVSAMKNFEEDFQIK
ncbi:MAG: putative dehydrogenase, subunit [Firmicutes bacterium]|nr:putative dehydrogenase, subunit [Bacillota bacterium]